MLTNTWKATNQSLYLTRVDVHAHGDPVFFHSKQSYWDWLPTEIQEHIVSLAWWQSVKDRRNPLKENLFRELNNYHALKAAWNNPPVAHGHIHITHNRCIKRCPNNINTDSHEHYSYYCHGKTCTKTHSSIWATYTMENGGQYDMFMGYNFPEAFRSINASLDIIKRHMAGEIRYDAYGTMFFWPPPLRPLSGTTPPSYLYSSNRAAEISYHWNSLS